MDPTFESSDVSVSHPLPPEIPHFVRLWHPAVRRATKSDLPNEYDHRIPLEAIFILPPTSSDSNPPDSSEIIAQPRLVVAKRCAQCADRKVAKPCSRRYPKCKRCEARGIACARSGEGWDILPGSVGSRGKQPKRKWLVGGAGEETEEVREYRPRKKAKTEGMGAAIIGGSIGARLTRSSMRIQKPLDVQTKTKTNGEGKGKKNAVVSVGTGKGRRKGGILGGKGKEKGVTLAGAGKGKQKKPVPGELKWKDVVFAGADKDDQKKSRGKGKGKQKEGAESLSSVLVAPPYFVTEVSAVDEHPVELLKKTGEVIEDARGHDVALGTVKAPKSEYTSYISY